MARLMRTGNTSGTGQLFPTLEFNLISSMSLRVVVGSILLVALKPPITIMVKSTNINKPVRNKVLPRINKPSLSFKGIYREAQNGSQT